MASKRASGTIPEWTAREQLILASAVQRSGDQNWVSVSRAVKPLVEDARPGDYFSQKNCALQYSAMLDKANHPKRKRSSDGTSDSVSTVEELIVHQLTEKRLAGLSTSIAETRKEFLALKKKIEQIDRGELDGELLKMWEAIQVELAAREGSVKGSSKSKQLSVTSAKSDDGTKRQKLISAAPISDDRGRAAGAGEKAYSTKDTEGAPSTAGDTEGPTPPPPPPSSTSFSSSHPYITTGRREEKMDSSPFESPSDLPPTPSSTPSSTLSSIPSSSSSSSFSSSSSATSSKVTKKKTESVSVCEELAAHEESPLPCPMTVPKEEKLQVSMVAAGLSRASPQPLSPHMHIIVQQPNIAAISSTNTTLSGVQQAARLGDFRGTAIVTQPRSQAPRSVVPSHVLQSPLVALTSTSAPITVGERSSLQSKPGREGQVTTSSASGFLSLSSSQPLPRPAAAITSSVSQFSSLSSLVSTSRPAYAPSISIHTLPQTLSSVTSTQLPLAPSASQPQYATQTTCVHGADTRPKPYSPLEPNPSKLPRLTLPLTARPSGPSFTPQPHSSPSVTRAISIHNLPLPPSLSTLTPSATSVVSSVLADPRLSASAVRTAHPPILPPPTHTPVSAAIVVSEQRERKVLRELKEDKMSEKAVRDQTLPVSQRVDREKEDGVTVTSMLTKVSERLPEEPVIPTTPLQTTPTELQAPPTKQEKGENESNKVKSGQQDPDPKPAPRLESAKPAPRLESAKPAPRLESAKPAPRLESAKPAPRLESAKPDLKQELESAKPGLKQESAKPAPKQELESAKPGLKQESAKPAMKQELESAKPGLKFELESAKSGPKQQSESTNPGPNLELESAKAGQKVELKSEETGVGPLSPKPATVKSTALPEKGGGGRGEDKTGGGGGERRGEGDGGGGGGGVEGGGGGGGGVEGVEEKLSKEQAIQEEAEEKSIGGVKVESRLLSLSPRGFRCAEMEEGTKHSSEMEEGSTAAMEEQVPPEAGSSRHSSVSELPSSPLTEPLQPLGMGDEEVEEEGALSKGKKLSKLSNRRLLIGRSRKRKLELDERMSVESTDFDSEEEHSSLFASAAPSPAPSQGDGEQEMGMSQKQWKKAIMLVWRHAAQHKYANLFLHPVREDDAPGYRDVIFRPMDLSSIKRSIETGVIKTDIEFQRDMLLMFQNAFMYNSSDHDVYHMAEQMRSDVMDSIRDYLTTQLQLIVESSTPKVLRSRDKDGRGHEEGTSTPAKKRRTRTDD